MAAFAATAAARAAPREEVRRALEAVYQDDRFQRVPVPEGPIALPDLEWLRIAAEAAGPLAHLASVLFWLFTAAVVAFLVVLIVRAVANRRPSGTTTNERLTATSRPLGERGERVTRADADALARQGRFAEAIHALLLAAITELGAQGTGALTPASTSREIWRALAPVAGSAREPFGELVRSVEWTLFGGRPADAAGYETCVRAYDTFADGLRARVP